MTRRDPAEAGPEAAVTARQPTTPKASGVKLWHAKPLPVGTVYRPKGATCQTCGQPLAFRLTAQGKWQPWEPEREEVHYHRRPPRTTCPHCGSAHFVTLYVGVERLPSGASGRADCVDCGRSWWVGKS